MKIKIKKGDIIILIFAILILVVSFFVYVHSSQGEYVKIKVDNHVEIYSLDENQTIHLKSNKNDYNIIVIHDKKVYVKESNCHNQNCVKHKAISKDRESIVCLPHKVFIEIIGNDKNETDN